RRLRQPALWARWELADVPQSEQDWYRLVSSRQRRLLSARRLSPVVPRQAICPTAPAQKPSIDRPEGESSADCRNPRDRIWQKVERVLRPTLCRALRSRKARPGIESERPSKWPLFAVTTVPY